MIRDVSKDERSSISVQRLIVSLKDQCLRSNCKEVIEVADIESIHQAIVRIRNDMY